MRLLSFIQGEQLPHQLHVRPLTRLDTSPLCVTLLYKVELNPHHVPSLGVDSRGVCKVFFPPHKF